MNSGETLGVAVFVSFLVAFGAAVLVVVTGRLGDVAVWILGAELLRSLATWGAVAAVVGALGWGITRGGFAGAHSHGNRSRAKVMRHEKAHQRALRKAGAGGSSRKIWRNPDGTWSGRVRASERRFRKLSAAAQIGVYAAGRCAAPDTGSCSDDKQIDQIVNRQPADERDLVRRQGEALGARWGR